MNAVFDNAFDVVFKAIYAAGSRADLIGIGAIDGSHGRAVGIAAGVNIIGAARCAGHGGVIFNACGFAVSACAANHTGIGAIDGSHGRAVGIAAGVNVVHAGGFTGHGNLIGDTCGFAVSACAADHAGIGAVDGSHRRAVGIAARVNAVHACRVADLRSI